VHEEDAALLHGEEAAPGVDVTPRPRPRAADVIHLGDDPAAEHFAPDVERRVGAVLSPLHPEPVAIVVLLQVRPVDARLLARRVVGEVLPAVEG